LRRLGTSTVVVAGVSVNLGVLGLAIEAVNLGYRVVVATDAVCGFPRDYADAVMQNSLSLVATRATVAEILSAWGETPAG
jgi:nicotinamidase-related amidase